MSLEQIKSLAESLSSLLDNNEKLAIPVLATKLEKCLSSYPQDKTLGSVSRVLSKMAEGDALFMRRADFRALYQKLYSNGTRFADLFQDELKIVDEEPKISTYARDDSRSIEQYQTSDPVLSNALHSLFSGESPKTYSQKTADQALTSARSALGACGLSPSSLSVSDGNGKFLMIQAGYETPKGVTNFFIPIEVHNGKISKASIFIGNNGPEDLIHSNIKAYVLSNAGAKLKCTGSTVLELLTQATTENREITSTELAVIKLASSRQNNSEVFANQIIGQKLDKVAQKDVSLPKSKQFESFEKEMSSPQGIASLQFGEKNIKLARDCVSRELGAFGYKNPQIVVSGTEQNTIYLSVALNNGHLGFTVPIRVADGKIQSPSIILCNGSVGSFSRETINNLNVSNQSDYKAASVASPLYGLKPSDLINDIMASLHEGNSHKAEDALNVLSQSGDQKAYAIGFDVFMQGLSGKNVKAAPTCNLIIKNSTSEHPICGHTGLSLHKTYQDKDGNCRPLYRKGQNEEYEAGYFMNSKIFG